ncbi:MAG: DNA-directed RNA polymerase subunit omega [bacterium]|nr:DNA-directed RNA polymerase subunit omega [bacterium]
MPFVPIEKLTKVVENKYEAVLVAAKEARVQNSIVQLKEADPNASTPKMTSLALSNVIDGKVKFFYGEEELRETPVEKVVLDIDDSEPESTDE